MMATTSNMIITIRKCSSNFPITMLSMSTSTIAEVSQRLYSQQPLIISLCSGRLCPSRLFSPLKDWTMKLMKNRMKSWLVQMRETIFNYSKSKRKICPKECHLGQECAKVSRSSRCLQHIKISLYLTIAWPVVTLKVWCRVHLLLKPLVLIIRKQLNNRRRSRKVLSKNSKRKNHTHCSSKHFLKSCGIVSQWLLRKRSPRKRPLNNSPLRQAPIHLRDQHTTMRPCMKASYAMLKHRGPFY